MTQQESILIEIDQILKRVDNARGILEISYESNDFSLTKDDYDQQCLQFGLIEKDLFKLFKRMVKVEKNLLKVATLIKGDE